MKNTYIKQIKRQIKKFDPRYKNKYFLFGSFVRNNRYHDIDLGITGNKKSKKNLSLLEEFFYHSHIPYKIDIVDFDRADKDFKKYVFSREPMIWIR